MMKNKCLTISAILLLGLFVASLYTQSALATHVAANWQTKYLQSDTEVSYEASVCNYINSCFNTENWASQDFTWQQTTKTAQYNEMDTVQSNSQDDYLAWFHVGNFVPFHVSGVLHYGYYQANDASPYMQDNEMSSHGGSKQHFTTIWTCSDGGLYWTDQYGDPLYGYIDNTYGTGVVGMPLAILKSNGYSTNGYNYPDYSGTCYIGFENRDKDLSQVYTNSIYNYHYSDFVNTLYLEAVIYKYSINAALDWATYYMYNSNGWSTFGASDLHNGYQVTINGVVYTCYMRIFGDGSMTLPT